ncbi:hypothetical protein PENARI_c015G11875 [Penicillium arizonense]|uniref:Uncharacterized protein n=1 Tax=Penicillium arizonense TaxID=1835702 RepID=A0A1F5LDB6_PENAI|nr:hypothetical protein PENARI_c015G11875 [Penicillium arizonense]OGE50931.1 hypothetical protein PENARI_c015G11875 [Penicillium arizonense]
MSPTVTRPGKRPQRGNLTSLQPNSSLSASAHSSALGIEQSFNDHQQIMSERIVNIKPTSHTKISE